MRYRIKFTSLSLPFPVLTVDVFGSVELAVAQGLRLLRDVKNDIFAFVVTSEDGFVSHSDLITE